MNLHAIVRNAITAVNPDQTVILLASAGQAQGEDYTQRPLWHPAVSVPAQVQPVPDKTSSSAAAAPSPKLNMKRLSESR